MSAFSDLVRGGFWRRVGAMMRKEFVQLRRDRITFATIITHAADAAHAVRLCHQHQAARSADGGAAAGNQRRRPLDPQGAGEHQILQGHAAGARRGRVRPRAGRRARCCSRSRSRAASSGRCAAATSRRCWSRPTPPTRSRPAPALGGARATSCSTALRNDRGHPRHRRAAVRDPHPRPLQPGRHRASSTSCRA